MTISHHVSPALPYVSVGFCQRIMMDELRWGSTIDKKIVTMLGTPYATQPYNTKYYAIFKIIQQQKRPKPCVIVYNMGSVDICTAMPCSHVTFLLLLT
jgi:outer membrane protein assembly factor BamE (lipoprotein component of BamABCDE complex)